jgi:hypothetical protein
MKTSCRRVKKQFPDALSNDMDATSREEFQLHLTQCNTCATEFKKLQKTLTTMTERNRPTPNAGFEQRLWQGIISEIEKDNKKTAFQLFVERYKGWWAGTNWRYSFALALATLLIGVILGKYFFSPSERTPLVSESQADNSAVLTRAEKYLDKSKILMLGILNHDPEDQTGLLQQKRISGEMLKEAAVLKNELKDSEALLMMHLISELEIILMQIANLEEQYDLESVELIRSGIEHKGILFKININQVRSDLNKTDQKKRGI